MAAVKAAVSAKVDADLALANVDNAILSAGSAAKASAAVALQAAANAQTAADAAAAAAGQMDPTADDAVTLAQTAADAAAAAALAAQTAAEQASEAAQKVLEKVQTAKAAMLIAATAEQDAKDRAAEATDGQHLPDELVGDVQINHLNAGAIRQFTDPVTSAVATQTVPGIVILNASGNITGVESGGTISGESADLNTVCGDIGEEGASLRLNVPTVGATAGRINEEGGSVYLSSQNDLEIGLISAAGCVSVTFNGRLTSGSGAMTAQGTQVVNIVSGEGANLTASRGIGTQTAPIGLDSLGTVVTSSSGSTYLNSSGRVLKIFGTTSGSYGIVAAGSVSGGASGKTDLASNNLTISANGSIGSEADPLQIYVPGAVSGEAKAGESHIQNSYTEPTRLVGGGGGGEIEIMIGLTAGPHGTISPSDGTFSKGDSVTFIFTPDEGYDVADVLVDGQSVGAVESYTFQNLSKSHTLEVIFRVHLIDGFQDLNHSAWYRELVERILQKSLFYGAAGATFSPSGTMTRAMFAVVLGRLAGIDPTASFAADFRDVSADAWYAGYVTWVAENGIVFGHADGTFGVSDSITREQIVTLLYRYALHAGLTAEIDETQGLAGYSDWEQISAYARPAMQWAVETGLLQGNGGRLMPTDKATRIRVAVILGRFCVQFSL